MDLIERQAAIDAVTPFDDEYRIRDAIENLPSAQPERKRGHWVGIDDEPCEVYECDVCGAVYDTVGNTWDLPNYCPYCGTDMREVDDERPD